MELGRVVRDRTGNATVSDPAGASLRFVPESADGYYDASSHVSVEVLRGPATGFITGRATRRA